MSAARRGWTTGLGFRDRRTAAVLAAILLLAGVVSAVQAVARPFWYDEMCTVIMCRLPNVSQVWNALEHGADTNPPGYYGAARLARELIPDDHLGYRSLSIVGLLATVLCLFAVLSRRLDGLSALVGAAFVLSTPLATYYSAEARPYALLLACISAAILAWQRIEDSLFYALGLAAMLAASLCLHYYAILIWPAFVVAELAVWASRRRFRPRAWVALAVGVIPLALFANLLMVLRSYYGQHFWARPQLTDAFADYNWLFDLGSWGFAFAAGVSVILAYWMASRRISPGGFENKGRKNDELPLGEFALIVMLLWLPAIAITAARIAHGGMTDRYLLPTILGGALGVGYVAGRLPQKVKYLLLALIMVNYGVGSGLSLLPLLRQRSLLQQRRAANGEVRTIFAQNPGVDLPLVVSSGLQYLPLAYYTPPDLRAKLFAITDPSTAVKFAGTDSVDLALLVLRGYFPLQVENFSVFAPKHREFLLLSNGDRFDWWPARLSGEGDFVRLLSATPDGYLYRVTLKPR